MAELNITTKLVLIQHELKAPKDKMNNFGKYKYRSCESILEAVKPLLHKASLALILYDEPVNVGERYYIKATAKLTDGKESIEVSAYARETDGKTGMDPAQLTGACSSYARKYALNGLFAIDDTKDADTNEFQEETKPKKAPPKKETKPDFGTASGPAKDESSETKPFTVESGRTAELALRELMKADKITEEQVLDAFKGKFSAIENMDEKSINGLIKKWEKFVAYTKGGK